MKMIKYTGTPLAGPFSFTWKYFQNIAATTDSRMITIMASINTANSVSRPYWYVKCYVSFVRVVKQAC